MTGPGIPVDPVAAVVEREATGEVAVIFADIRATLGVDVINLIWRHLATLPGALPWAWSRLKPLYSGPAPAAARNLRAALALPATVPLSAHALAAAGIDDRAHAGIDAVLDSYQHTNALALVALSALLAAGATDMASGASVRSETADKRVPSTGVATRSIADVPAPERRQQPLPLPSLPPVSTMDPPLAALVTELNRFGEDRDFALVASMYRHLSHWPSYLALLHTLLMPLEADGRLHALVAATRGAGRHAGDGLVAALGDGPPMPDDHGAALAAIRRFVDHPIARMVGVCALIRAATPRGAAGGS